MQSSSTGKLVVSFHDLHPGTMKCCIRFLQRLEIIGVPRASLLVVPNWYDKLSLTRHPECCAWLREQPHDISLHGWTHLAGHRAEKPIEWLMANKYTAGEGEFYKLPPHDAEMLILQGLEVFRRIGIEANGFIPPAWLMKEAHLPILGKVGLDYAVTLNKFFDVQRNKVLRAPVLCTTSRTPLRRALTRQVVSALAKKHANEPILRIAVHPVDFRYPEIEAFIYRLIAQCLETRESTTYDELVAHQGFESASKDHAAEQQIEVVGEKAP
ncbi:polysaccharide deacetylase family protein [Pontiellaceae bacterium B1224]|nr:polysaccharide deacetylase family protein [Pontiellaceae bacterium B1224]